jgi:hypothetical protein
MTARRTTKPFGRSAALRGLIGCAVVILVAGCAQFITPKPPPPDPTGGAFVPLTAPIIALGDTQEHEVTGFPLHDNDGAVDAYVEVAQRPPEQPLFGRRILEWALLVDPDTPVIHLGDLLDMSCESEMDRMARVFATAWQPKAILPGNHDGFFMGIFNHNVLDGLLDGESAKWERTCRRGTRESAKLREATSGAALTKRGFIVAYLDNLARGPHTRVTGLDTPSSGDASVSWRNPDPQGFIAAIEARIRGGGRFGHSFVAQQLRLPAAPGAPRRVVMIGLDTNQVDVVVGVLDALRGVDPGDIGHVRADQLDAVAAWVEEARRAGDVVVFAGHHNWNRLSFGSQARLASIMATLDHPLVYVSAHTHRGFWASHRIGSRSLLELNVSSLSDWPIAYRRVTFALDPQANRMKVTAAIKPNLGVPPRSDRDLLDAWEVATCQGTGYSPSVLEEQELLVVQQQREARGTLKEWLYQGLGEWCRPCQQSLYESGMRYQDALLEVIGELYQDFQDKVPEAAALRVPDSCGDRSLTVCIARLRAERAADLDGTIRLFRARAQLIDQINVKLDTITDPRVRSYMVCRAVIAAHTDYALTPDDKRSGRGEANRRSQDFFRIEATVGVD